jgi:hypothetical protein
MTKDPGQPNWKAAARTQFILFLLQIVLAVWMMSVAFAFNSIITVLIAGVPTLFAIHNWKWYWRFRAMIPQQRKESKL